MGAHACAQAMAAPGLVTSLLASDSLQPRAKPSLLTLLLDKGPHGQLEPVAVRN